MRALALVALLVSALPLALPGAARAQAFFDQPRLFFAERACDAHTSIRKQTAPVPLMPGADYTALGENKRPGGTHVLIEVADQRKWVALDCGRLDGGDGHDDDVQHADCLPFFDDDDNPIPAGVGGRADITPPAPPIEPFGEALNAVCGEPGKAVSRDEFRVLMQAHPDVLARIMAFTDGRVFADRPRRDDPERYLDDLTDAWLAIHAFDHIVCGEPRPGGNIGGLHFHGRYQQLQAAGDACRIPNFSRNEVVPGVIYSMGVRIPMPGGDASAPIKGYGLTMSGEDIFKVVTRAFAENPTLSTSSQGCLLELSDDGHDFTAVFVRRRAGIRTFFPDATPDPRRNGPCAGPIVLTTIDVNRPPAVAEPLTTQQVWVGVLSELPIPANTFVDPDGEGLRLAVAGNDGAPLPSWMDFDAENGSLLVLPEAEHAGSELVLTVTASDGRASATTPLSLQVLAGASTPLMIDLDAREHVGEQAVTATLPPGLYLIEPAGTADGGRFDAWSRAAEDDSWQRGYRVQGPEVRIDRLAGALQPSPAAALEAAGATALHLAAGGEVAFSIDDERPEDNRGGVSLRVVRMGDAR